MNKSSQSRIYPSVQLLKKIMVLAMLTLWSLASNHCKLAQLTALELLQCCATETVTAHPESDCDTDGCAPLENGFYKTEDRQQLAQATILTVIFTAALIGESQPLPPQTISVPTSPPPELSTGWQFISRTAASPRAPSFAS